MNIIALPMKDRVISGANDHIEVAGRSSMGSGVAFAGNANALAVARTSFNTDFKRFGLFYSSFAMTGAAGCYVFSSAVAARAGRIELHAPPGLRDLATPAALGTRAWRFDIALTVAGSADNAPGDVQLHDAAPDRRPERNVDLVLQVRPRLRPFVRRAATPPEHAGEDVFETAAPGAGGFPTAPTFEQVGEIEAAEIEICALTSRALGLSARKPSGESPRRPTGPAARPRISLGGRGIDVVRIKPELVVNLPLLGIAQNIVGLGERLKLLLGPFVPGIDIGMVLARKFAERLANVLGRGRLLHPEDVVVLFLSGCCHRYRCILNQTLSS